MITTTQPNTVISNLCWPIAVACTTMLTMRVRNSLCTKHPRLRTQYAVEMRHMLFVNMNAMAYTVLWCAYLNLDLADLCGVDMLVGIWLERWLMKVLKSMDPQTYHPGGPIGRIMINQRMRYGLIVCALARGYAAATLVAVQPYITASELAMPLVYGALPCMYTLIRCCALDVELYQASVMRNTCLPVEDEFEISGPGDDDDDDDDGCGDTL